MRYVAASESRKRELREAYGFRLADGPRSIAAAGTPDTVDPPR